MLSGIGTVLLMILKVIGILLLVILGLLVLVVFVPIRYKAVVDKQEDTQETLFKGAISWFGIVLRIPFGLVENKFQYKIKIFGIPYSGKKNKKKGKKKNHDTKKGKKKASEQKGEETKVEEIKAEETKADDSNMEVCKEETSTTKEDKGKKSKKKNRKNKKNKKDAKGKSKEKKSLFRSLADWKKLIIEVFRTLKKMIDAGMSLKDIITSEEGSGFVCIIKENLLYLWKKIRPRIRGFVVFGTGDPCTTGEVLGGLSMFYAWTGRNLEIAPDFENERLETHLVIRGRITVFTLLLIAFKIMTNDDFKKTYARLKKWKENI